MKTLFALMAFLMMAQLLKAQSDTITHIIQRGESLAYLSEKYGVSEADIKSWNGGGLDLFYTGMEVRLVVPRQVANAVTQTPTGSQSDHPIFAYMEKFVQASTLHKNHDYKKAIKAYTALIDKFSKTLPCADAYYNRGLAYYSLGKWKRAIKDFSHVSHSTDLSEKQRTNCQRFLAQAKSKRAEQLERRSEMWGGIFQAAAEIGLQTYAANQQANGTTTLYTGGGSQTTSSDYLLNPNYAVAQVNAQYEAEYQQLKRFNPSLTREEFMRLKTEAYNQQKNGSGNGGIEKDEKVSTESTRRCKKLSATDYAHCEGMKVCQRCNGKKRYYTTAMGNGRWVDPCGNCSGTGLCPSCNGKGYR